MQDPLPRLKSMPKQGIDRAQPEVLLVSSTRQRMRALEDLLPLQKWRSRAAYSLDQALDLMKEQTPWVVLIDRSHLPSGLGSLRDWLEGVSAILPVILLVKECDSDHDTCLLGIGVFRTVRMSDLQGSGLPRLLDSAIEWADLTGRRRPPSQASPLLMAWRPDGAVLEVSPALADALGWPASALSGRHLDDLVAPASMNLRSRWSEAGSQRLQLLRRDGSRWPVSVVRMPMLGASGQPERMVGIFGDLDRNQRLDPWAQRRAQLVAQKLKAERANQSKARFMAAISHDLRQPMHALGLFVQELRGQTDPTRIAAMLEPMAQSLASMESLLDSVLALSRLESDQMTPNLQAFGLEPILVRLRLTHRATARMKGLRYSVASTEAVVMSDPALLERMLSNLVVNALQYTHQGGVLLTCRPRGRWMRLQVWDTGIGIPPEQHDAVFREFYRIEPDNDSRKGVGLGLAIVRSCARMLGLNVTLRSTVGRGSCFTIDVPLALDIHGPEPAPTPQPPAVAGELQPVFRQAALPCRVLVEADALQWEWLGPLLESWGCTVIRSAPWPQQDAGPDVVILTALPMPTDATRDFMESARRATRPDLPVILITADTSLPTAREARWQHVQVLNPPVLAARLHHLLASVDPVTGWGQPARS